VSRIFWLAVGATAGVVATRKVSRTLDRISPGGFPGGVPGGLAGVAGLVREFADEVLASMAEREWELRESMGLRELQAEGPDRSYIPRLVDHPARHRPGAAPPQSRGQERYAR
jgi:hypothetical protein